MGTSLSGENQRRTFTSMAATWSFILHAEPHKNHIVDQGLPNMNQKLVCHRKDEKHRARARIGSALLPPICKARMLLITQNNQRVDARSPQRRNQAGDERYQNEQD